MSEPNAAPRLRKWPFYLADLVLSGIAAWLLYRMGAIEGTGETVVALGCLLAAAWAAWLSVSPWLLEHRTGATLSETGNLARSLEQIRDLERVAELIRQANSQWQSVQDSAGRTVNAAREITDRMKIEADEFMKFIQSAHDQERASLRLEVEKLRRGEGEWIKAIVQMLDHVYAITRAAERSGQQNLITQLRQFQNACRDSARRVGLAPFIPEINEPFDARAHQLPNPDFNPPAGSKIGDILATGFTYQGQLLRRALVLLQNPEEPPKEEGEAAKASVLAEDSGAAESTEKNAVNRQAASEPSPVEEEAPGGASASAAPDSAALDTEKAAEFEAESPRQAPAGPAGPSAEPAPSHDVPAVASQTPVEAAAPARRRKRDDNQLPLV